MCKKRQTFGLYKIEPLPLILVNEFADVDNFLTNLSTKFEEPFLSYLLWNEQTQRLVHNQKNKRMYLTNILRILSSKY